MELKDYQLFVFDLDGTLSSIGEPIIDDLQTILQMLCRERKVVIATGKPFSYIAGLCRQLGITDVTIISENGAVTTNGGTFPPRTQEAFSPADNIVRLLAQVREHLSNNYGGRIWFQPNEVVLTIFPYELADLDAMYRDALKYQIPDIRIYRHKDSIDVVPSGFDKGTALQAVMQRLSITRENAVVFADGENDIPLFSLAGHLVIVGNFPYHGQTDLTRLGSIYDLRNLLWKAFERT